MPLIIAATYIWIFSLISLYLIATLDQESKFLKATGYRRFP